MNSNSVRSHLIAAVAAFVHSASTLTGVMRISLVGSLATPKPDPKDADVIVTVSDDLDLTQLARIGRQLKGTTQRINRGADIFVAGSNGEYIGRICRWRECRPGIRQRCFALNCGLRQYLYDDLDDLCLDSHLIAEPPLDLWPKVVERAVLPADVREIMILPMRELKGMEESPD